jgi:two-component sensor histidine kinase
VEFGIGCNFDTYFQENRKLLGCPLHINPWYKTRVSNKSSLLMRASLVAVLAVAPVAATVVVLQSDLRRQGADAARAEALRQTREAAARLGRFVEGLRDALAVVAETPAVRNGDAAGCTAMLTQLKARFGDQILLSANAADGWAVCNTAGVAPRSVRNGERSSHQLPLQAGGFAVGVWEPGTGPRNSGLHLGLPIQTEGGIGFAGTMTAAVEVARLADLLRAVPLPPGAELILADRNDRVVLRLGGDAAGDLKPGDAVPPALKSLLPALPAAGVDADAATGRLVDAAGERGASRLVALAPYVPGTDGALRLAVSYDPSSLPAVGPAAATGGSGSMAMALGVGGLALALIVAFVGARVLLSRPLANALAAAASSGAGQGRPAAGGGAVPPQPAAAGRDGEALLALALETGNLGAWELDPATRAFERSEGFDAIFGYGRPVDRWTWRGFLRHILPEERAAAEEAFRRLRAEPGSIAHEVRIYREGDGDLRTLHLRAAHQRAPDGSPRIFGVLADVTDAVAAQASPPAAHPAPAAPAPPAGEQFRMSTAELSHRVRGMLATVQGIAAETLRAPPGTGGLIPAAAKAAFEARLSALGRSHEMLMREDGAKADLSELVSLVLAPHAAGGPAGGRYTAEGPSLWLPAATALPLSVALHELATNAARHGALSQPKGSVSVSWRLEEVGPGHAPMLRLRWEERGGPQLDGPPRRRGFGLKLLETGLAPEIGGLVSLEFRPTGLVCEIEAPLKAAAAAVPEAV